MSESSDWMTREQRPPVDLHIDRPHGARVYDFLLGGKTNYAADREQAQKVLATIPAASASARANRAFIHRAARVLVSEFGIRQFLDVGTGIPTPPNLHEVVQQLDPTARIVYADNDPIVLCHSRALHTSTPEGATSYIEADATEPESILTSSELLDTIDLSKPVTLNLCLLLHWLPPQYDAYGMVRTMLDALPVGSALVISHITADFDEGVGRIEDDFEDTGSTVRTRTRAQVARFFDGLELLEPGIQAPQRWRPEAVEVGDNAILDKDVPVWAGVAVKTTA